MVERTLRRALLGLFSTVLGACSTATPLAPTLADLAPIHGDVSVTHGDAKARSSASLVRLESGDVVQTDAAGRARARLDDGTTLLLDRDTRVAFDTDALVLEAGRVFARVPEGTQAHVRIGAVTVLQSNGSLALEKREQTRVYVAEGQATLTAPNQPDQEVSSGEVASIDGNRVAAAPGRAFEDWTEGLMAPWAALDVSRRALGEVWGRQGDALGSPLAVRSHDVKVTIDGEVATTRVTTRYFNGSSASVVGDFRFALPPEAIVSSFRYGQGEELTDTSIALAEREGTVFVPDSPRLEWAGEGWLRGQLPYIASGALLTVESEYVEWLEPVERGGQRVVQYRYPMVAEGDAPIIGEFTATVDAHPSKPTSLASGMGAEVDGDEVRLRRSDFRPSADLVVEVGLPPDQPPARLYRVPAEAGDDGGDYVMVRTDAPTLPAGPTPIVFVLDTSRSVERSGGDAARAFLRAALAALADTDRVLVLAADQSVRALGGAELAPLSAKRREDIARELGKLVFGGATDLGAALQAAVTALPHDDPRALVVYVGDGWATLGDESLQALQARLARSAGFLPQIGAVAVGTAPNRVLLSALTRQSGPMFEAGDTVEAAEVAVDLVARSGRPTVAAVSLDLGPGLERVYPTHPVTVASGAPITFLGRLRGELPKNVTLRYREGSEWKTEQRGLGRTRVSNPDDLRRRWARARVEQLVLEQQGRELVTQVALASGLITPWTALTPEGSRYVPTDLSTMLLDMAYPPSGGLLPTLWPSHFPPSVLDRPTTSFAVPSDDPDLDSALAAAIRRKLKDALEAVRACRDSRAQLLPNPPKDFDVKVEVDGKGVIGLVAVVAVGLRDLALERCIQNVVTGLSFPSFGSGSRLEIEQRLSLSEYVPSRNRRCSAESRLPLGSRRGVWQEELSRVGSAEAALELYMNAKRDCELRSWREKRTLLELVLEHYPDPSFRLDLVAGLVGEGQLDAGDFVRRETLLGARSPEEFRQIEQHLIGDERLPLGEFKKAYGAAKDDAARLQVVRRFLLLAPHDDRLRELLVALLGVTDQKVLLLEEVRRLREDPFTNVGLLGDAASALRQAGFEAESRRAFGELIERAPEDPWVRAFLGDRLRNEGYYDDATLTYSVLEHLAPDEPRVIVRQALAHAGAGRIDIARRMLMRVAETGGRNADPTLARLARQLVNVLLARSLANDPEPEAKEALMLITRASPHPRRGSLVLLEAPAARAELELSLEDPDGSVHHDDPFAIRDPGMGLYSIERSVGLEPGTVLTVRAPERPAPLATLRVGIETLSFSPDAPAPARTSSEIELPRDGQAIELLWDGASFVPKKRG